MIIAAAFSRGPWLIYIMFASGAFGMLQMAPGDGGGLNVLPQAACAAVFVLKVLSQPGNIPRAVDAALDPYRIGLLTAFTLYGVIGSYCLPRLFAELAYVVPVSSDVVGGTEVLRPSKGNITQSCYLLLSYGTTLAFCIIGATKEFRRHYALANLYAGMTIIITGMMDAVLYSVGLSDLLTPFRTATYVLISEAEIEGVKRVIGLMSEASAYGGLCIGTGGALIFLLPFFHKGRESLVAAATAMLLLVMGVLSTSSGAYVGFAILCGIYGVHMLVRLASRDDREARRSRIELGLLSAAGLIVLGAFIVQPSLFDFAFDMVDKLVFQKSVTASYIERTSWTRAGWEAFLDSGTMGVGIGSIRVSNWSVSILGSTGLFGALLMFGFLVQQLVFKPRKASPEVQRYNTAVQLSLLPLLAIAQLSATMPDLGVSVAAALGVLAAPRRAREHPQQVVSDAQSERDRQVVPSQLSDRSTAFG
ncbi:hypothetical protein FMGBMHLM_4132 [Methylobacterium aerolatum]|nr:hypothetical protein FMGBMHLM_4132 [Methylobacterium aerolatum]